MEEHDAAATVGFNEQNSGGFQRAANLVACSIVDLESPFGLEALQGGQGHQGFFGEHLLLPIQLGSRGPNLSAGDHS
jgi:hypothetical protein